jgi:hypothetical protein
MRETVADSLTVVYSNDWSVTWHAVGITICRVASHGGMAVPGDCVLRLVLEMQAGKRVRDWAPNQSSGK